MDCLRSRPEDEDLEGCTKAICLICSKLIAPSHSELSQGRTQIQNSAHILHKIAKLLQVSLTIYKEIDLESVPAPLLCPSCLETVSSALELQEYVARIQVVLRKEIEGIKREFVRSVYNENSPEGIRGVAREAQVERIRKTYAQCWAPCTVRIERSVAKLDSGGAEEGLAGCQISVIPLSRLQDEEVENETEGDSHVESDSSEDFYHGDYDDGGYKDGDYDDGGYKDGDYDDGDYDDGDCEDKYYGDRDHEDGDYVEGDYDVEEDMDPVVVEKTVLECSADERIRECYSNYYCLSKLGRPWATHPLENEDCNSVGDKMNVEVPMIPPKELLVQAAQDCAKISSIIPSLESFGESEVNTETEDEEDGARGTESYDTFLTQEVPEVVDTTRNVRIAEKSGNPQNQICELCGEGFETGTSLKQHQELHSECEVCGKRFLRPQALRMHEYSHLDGSTQMECGMHANPAIDGAGTRQKRKNPHSISPNTSKKAKPMEKEDRNCPAWEKMISKSSNLEVHVESHKGEEGFPDRQCPRFNAVPQLLLHLYQKGNGAAYLQKYLWKTATGVADSFLQVEAVDNSSQADSTNSELDAPEQNAPTVSPQSIAEEPTSNESGMDEGVGRESEISDSDSYNDYAALEESESNSAQAGNFKTKSEYDEDSVSDSLSSESNSDEEYSPTDETASLNRKSNQNDFQGFIPQSETDGFDIDEENATKESMPVVDKVQTRTSLKVIPQSGRKPYTKPKGIRKCPICDFVLTKRVNFDKHVELHNGEKDFPCKECPARYRTASQLINHTKSTHSKGRRRQSYCRICKLRFPPESLRDHQRDQHGVATIEATYDEDKNVISFECHACRKTYNRESYRTDGNRIQILCQLGNCPCEVTFTDFQQFMNHHKRNCTLLYWVNRPAVATVIPEANTKVTDELAAHTHGGSGSQHDCEVCGKSFSYESLLKKHRSTHKEFRPFRCEECGKSFKLKKQLNEHRQSHSEPKFPCHVCGKLFKSIPYVRHHVYATHAKRRAPRIVKVVRKVPQCDAIHNDNQADSTNNEVDASEPHSDPVYQELISKEPTSGERGIQGRIGRETESSGSDFDNGHAALKLEDSGPSGARAGNFKSKADRGKDSSSDSLISKSDSVDDYSPTDGAATVNSKNNQHQFEGQSGQYEFSSGEENASRASPPAKIKVQTKTTLRAPQRRDRKTNIQQKEDRKCPICDSVLTKRVNFDQHVELHNGEKDFPCKECPARYPTVPQLINHTEQTHSKGRGRQRYCRICKQSFPPEGFRDHQRDKHGVATMEATFDEYKNIFSFECNACRKIYLRDSYKTEDNQIQILCCHRNCSCQDTFTDFHQFMNHHKKVCTLLYRANPPSAATSSPNSIAEVNAKGTDELGPHTSHHHNGSCRLHACEVCGKCFKYESLLREHRTTHQDLRPFQCEECGKSYKLKKQLNEHRQSHSEPKVPCPVCGKLFKSIPNVRNHIYSTHDKRRPPRFIVKRVQKN